MDFSVHDGKGDGWGYNLGALFFISEKTSVGASFRSQVRVKFKGSADLGGVMNGGVFTTLTFPPMAVLGISHRLLPEFVLEVDAQWTGWSTMKNLDLSFDNPAFNNSSIPRDWKDVFAIRVGGEYRVNQVFAFRAGYTYDETPIPHHTLDPILQDATRDIFSIGIGFSMGFLITDLAYNVFFLRERDVDNSITIVYPTPQQGTYETTAHLFGLNFTFIF